MELRTGQPVAARDAVVPFLRDPLLSRSACRGLALYYHGFASFLLKDYLAAGRSLGLLAPFDETAYGTHARYLLARVHELTDERPEALVQFEGVLADYERQKKRAAEALAQPNRFADDPSAKARLAALRDGLGLEFCGGTDGR